ncbi:MAG: biosynthetic-type acetolactate synthase large subunit [Kiritimatiellae bacterium]|jgi:acetolactate synthase-1/2/3 large subunit|nr:biosynthetic-type acetolactate synthase large subunit [Kiritimatiellia bacterium]
MSKSMTGAEILVDALIKEGTECLFGYPGGVVIPIFDVLYKRQKEIRFILARHEQGAAHMADGYARASGKVGVCLATSGPGATNLVTGIATAHMDSIPVVFITGQVNSALIGTDAFQEANIMGITQSITKHNYLVNDVKDLPRIITEAFHIAATGRPGPVLIDLPVDVSNSTLEDYSYPTEINIRGYKPSVKGHRKQITKAAEFIANSERPVIFAGGGVVISDSYKELRELAEKINAPVTTTLMALGVFPEDHELHMGMPGMHGTKVANFGLMECDLIISIGARFDDRITGDVSKFAPNAKIIHIDIDPASVSKIIKVDVPVVGDAKSVLEELIPIVAKREKNHWNDEVAGWKKEHKMFYRTDDTDEVKPQYVVERLCANLPKDSIIATEVGQNQMWAAQYYEYTYPRQLLTSGGLGTMGFGLPAAIGAQLAFPGRTVIDIAGDGSIQMNIQELATAFVERVPVKVAILNNGYLGMVRQWQDLFWDKNYSGTCLKRQVDCPDICCSPSPTCAPYVPDFVKLAESYNVLGLRCTEADKVDETIQKAMAYDGPVVMEFIVAKEENVFPMVPAGKPINEILDVEI